MPATTSIPVRHAAVPDAPEIARLLTLLGHPTEPNDTTQRLASWASDANIALVAPAAGGLLAGLITLHTMEVLHRRKPVGRITALVVDQDLRGSGIGTALLRTAERLFIERGCGLIEVTSNLRLPDAHAFYAKLGYERTSVRFAKRL